MDRLMDWKSKRPENPCKSTGVGGEGGIGTHGTVTRTTVFETAPDNGVPRLKDRMIKVQTTLVAGPRNHLYRGRSLPIEPRRPLGINFGLKCLTKPCCIDGMPTRRA